MLLIQPQSRSCGVFDDLADREGLGYELLDPSLPFCLGNADKTRDLLSAQTSGGHARSLHGAFIDVNPASGDEALRLLSCRRCEESCALAERLSLRHVVFHGSCFPFLRGGYLLNWAETCARFYDALTERHPGLTVYVENSMDLDPDPLLALTAHTSDRVRICLDLGHANYSRVSPEKWFEALGNRIGYLHLSDNLGQYDDHLPLGEGTVDWGVCSRLASPLGDIPMTLEVGGPEGIAASLRYLGEKHYFGR